MIRRLLEHSAGRASPPRARRDRVAATLLVAELHEQASLECAASSRISRRHVAGSQPKMSKTTPCKVAGSRRHGCALGKYLTRRANQRHSFIIAQSVRYPWPRNRALFGAVLGENSYPQLKCVGSPQRVIACALPYRRASDARA